MTGQASNSTVRHLPRVFTRSVPTTMVALLLHGFHYLEDEGVMAIILPHGVLFRGGADERIRTKLLKDGHIDTVIGENGGAKLGHGSGGIGLLRAA